MSENISLYECSEELDSGRNRHTSTEVMVLKHGFYVVHEVRIEKAGSCTVALTSCFIPGGTQDVSSDDLARTDEG